MPFSVRSEVPEWVVIETATLNDECLIGRVIEIWYNQIKVEYAVPPGSFIRGTSAIGIYTFARNTFREPTLSDWILHAQRLGDL